MGTIEMSAPGSVGCGQTEEHLGAEERRLAGKAARTVTPRRTHAEYTARASRPDPVEVLQEQGALRQPELLPIRYGRMLASPFSFFRGAAAIMAGDLVACPTSGFETQICGDAHLANFGLYGSPERHLVFDVNDFDDTATGPWEWDVKRLATSVEIAGRGNGHSAAQRRDSVLATVRSYRGSMRAFATMRHLDLWYQRTDLDDPRTLAGYNLDAQARARAARAMAKARTRHSDRSVAKLTEVRDGERHIVAAPPLLEPIRRLVPEADAAEVEERVYGVYRDYLRSLPPDRRRLLEQFRYVDVARRVGGVGSVGTRCWVVLLVGRDDADLLFLQVKEAPPSAVAGYAGDRRHENQGERVVLGQQLMQSVSDILLGWHRSEGLDGVSRDFYVRQLADWKGGAEIESLRPDWLLWYGELCAWALARGHARSGDRIAIAGYLGAGDTFDRGVARFAAAYAEQNARDYHRLVDAVAAGHISAEPGS
jgi:uncharacterized protein (DUF2252 family)